MQQTVKVRILLDSLSILPSLIGKFKDILYGMTTHENIKLKFYEPINFLLPFHWNKRLHDKIIIIDENLVLMGGRNIADNFYIEKTGGKKFSNDRDVVIFKDESISDHESVIKDIKDYYERTWNYRYSKSFKNKLNSRQKAKSRLAKEKLNIEHSKMKNSSKEKLVKINWNHHTLAVKDIRFVSNPVGIVNHDPWCLRELLFLSSQAEESIFMQSPYFIPSRRIKSIFNQFNIDLEKTTLLTNSYHSSPNYVSIAAYSNHRKKMVQSDVRIYEYQGEGSIHGKTYIFDDRISVIGSFNLDARSSYINSESMIVIDSEEFAGKLKKNVQVDLDNSLIVGKDYSYVPDNHVEEGKVSNLKKIILEILSKITPVFEHLL